MPLGLQGTSPGSATSCRPAATAGTSPAYEGNRRGPINRETYRVTAVRDDGGLEVAPITRPRRRTGERSASGSCCPPHYVAEHLALGYASTVHAAQGLTVDTTHTVVTARTGAGRALRRR